jgi:chromosome segregation ATPase
MTISQQIEKLNADLKAAQEEITRLKAENATAITGATAPLQAQIQTLTQERDAEKQAHEKTKGELTKANAEVERLKGEAKTADQRAMDIVASLGVPPLKKDNAINADSEENLFQQHAAEKDPQKKAELWLKIKAALNK